MKIGQDTVERIVPSAIEQVRTAIAEVDGREVFFAGTLNSKGLVETVRVCSRGSDGAVPAFLQGLGARDVVLHNHPSGDVAPSEADLELASVFGTHGHGVYIVDNEVTRVYVVVEPFLLTDRKLLDPDQLAGALAPGSPLSKTVPGFEERPQQLEMMQAAIRAFNEDGIAVVEAPTGVGKTIAYLLPAVSWAVKNRERVVISTRTINLQEQIIHKDIPVLAKCVDEKFSAVLVKGRGNYLCRRKLGRALSEASLFDDQADAQAIQGLAEWAEKTRDGSRSDLPYVPAKQVWDRVCSDADLCRPSTCPNAKDCFVTRARRDVAKADILVVNHHMLFADLAIKREMGRFTSLGVLPAYKRIIFDEAHNIEDSATEYFGVRVTRSGVMAVLGHFIQSERGPERGLLPYVKLKVIRDTALPRDEQDQILDLVDNTILPAIAMTREAFATAFDAIRHLTAERCGKIGRDIKWRLTQDILDDEALRDLHTVYVLPAVEEAQNCAKSITSLCTALKQASKAQDDLGRRRDPVDGIPYQLEIAELQSYRDRLVRLANAFAGGTSEKLEENTVRWVEIDSKRDHIVRVVRCPLEVGAPLAEWVYPNLDTVFLTSATLAVRSSFEYLFSRIGLDRLETRPIESCSLDSPFNFEEQALFCIPTDIAEPNEKAFLDEVVDHLREALSITRGHAFILFTSFYALDHAYRQLEQELQDKGIVALRQGAAARTQLLERFRNDPSSVLFATDSFWEGVDVAGDALQCVILPKLPFRVPTEPILEARAEAIDAAGGNAFMEFTVPQAVIKFRQGFGRLIRRRTDRGAILTLDRRIVHKFYGKIFLASLPGVRVVKGPRRGVYAALRAFFASERGGPQNGGKT